MAYVIGRRRGAMRARDEETAMPNDNDQALWVSWTHDAMRN
jgi:hypothetical protein